MAKNKRELQAELEAANQCIAELSPANHNTIVKFMMANLPLGYKLF